VVLGTTGEGTALTKDEKTTVIQTVIAANNDRLPLVLGVGGNNTQTVTDQFKTHDLAPFTAILSVSPAYNKPTQEGIYQHFAAIARCTAKPIILYNVPGRTASNMLPRTVLRLANDFENIVAIKEAAGDMVQAMRLIADKPDGFLVISGDDMLALPTTLAGGSGVISVIAQGLPKVFSAMVRHGLNGETKEAYSLHYKTAPLIDLIFEEGNPAGIKSMLHHLNICGKEVRLPLVAATTALDQKIARDMRAL
ncbi:MAG: 4-hydroxy-tetrahydrodipicolinate synthase, partial [Marinirhabdus sp.]